MVYNSPDSIYYQEAERLKKEGAEVIKSFIPKIEPSRLKNEIPKEPPDTNSAAKKAGLQKQSSILNAAPLLSPGAGLGLPTHPQNTARPVSNYHQPQTVSPPGRILFFPFTSYSDQLQHVYS